MSIRLHAELDRGEDKIYTNMVRTENFRFGYLKSRSMNIHGYKLNL